MTDTPTDTPTDTTTEVSNKTSWMIVGGIIALTVVVFAIFFLIPERENKITYNAFEFVYVNELWQTEWERDGQLYIPAFRFHPKEVENVPITGNVDSRFRLESVYLTVDPSQVKTEEEAYLTVAAVELSLKLESLFEGKVVTACTRNETDGCVDRPIITCENTNSTVMYLKQAGEAKVVVNGNCVTIQGAGEEIVRAVDKVLYQWMGIIT